MVFSLVRRHPKLTVLAWILFFAVTAIGAGQLNNAVKAGGFNNQHGRSFEGVEINREALDDPENELSVVLKSSSEITPSVLDSVEASITQLPHVKNVMDGREVQQLRSSTGQTQIIQVGIDASNTTTQNMVPTLREKVSDSLKETEIESHVTGAPALDYDLNIQSQKDALHAEMIAFPLLILVLLLIYRSIGPTIITLAIAGVCLVGTQGVGALLSKITDVSNMYITGASLIGLAVSVDYCLFLIARYRENLQRGETPVRALELATHTVGHAIRFGGLSVIAALCALFIPRNMVFSSIALAGIVVTSIALAAIATLLPAALTLLGNHVFFGQLTRAKKRNYLSGKKFSRSLQISVTRPILVAVAVVVPLLIVTTPLASLKLQVPVASASILPEAKDSREGIEAIQSELNARELFPTSVTFRGQRGESSEEVNKRAQVLAEKLTSINGVDQVLAPGSPEESFSPYPLTGSFNGLNYARILVTSTELPDSDKAHEMVYQLMELTKDKSGVFVTGATAQGMEFDQLVETSIPWIIGVVFLISLALLSWAFRSWQLPTLAVILNGLVVSSAMGLLSLVWKISTGNSINSVTPVVIFAIVFGLSIDYMVLMASRMREEFTKSHKHVESITRGVSKTSRLVISAAIIMIGVFLSFMVAEISIVRELGLGLAMAVAIDALIVRPFLLPSTITLLGPKNWASAETKTRKQGGENIESGSGRSESMAF